VNRTPEWLGRWLNNLVPDPLDKVVSTGKPQTPEQALRDMDRWCSPDVKIDPYEWFDPENGRNAMTVEQARRFHSWLGQKLWELDTVERHKRLKSHV